ncbi:uncharacterized protein [Ptychodera flava]|uniref:uncharacterized protein n=1 Tax=Ptychodera flava TaxID=63121 RepID=UPI00396A0550
MGCLQSVLCPFLGCVQGNDDEKDDSKKVQIKKLEMAKTNISDLDKTFDDAVAPFNETIDSYEAYLQAIEQFKLLTGHKKWNSIEESILGLKKSTYPDLTLEVKDETTIVLTLGSPSNEDNASSGDKITGCFDSINETSTKISESFKSAIESTNKIVADADELKGRVGDSELSQEDKAQARKNVGANVRKCERAPAIQDAVMENIGEFNDELKEVAKKLTDGDEKKKPEATETTKLLDQE